MSISQSPHSIHLLQPKIPPHLPSFSFNPNFPQIRLIKNINPSREKSKIRNPFRPRNHNLPNRFPLPIPNMNPIATPREDIPFSISVNSIRNTIRAVSEHPAVLQRFAIGCDVVAVDCSGIGLVVHVRDAACVGDIDVFEIRGEFNAVGGNEVVCYCLDYAGFWGEAVYLVGEQNLVMLQFAAFTMLKITHLGTNRRLETISLPTELSAESFPFFVGNKGHDKPKRISRIGEPQIPSMRMLHNIINTGKVPPIETIQQHFRAIRRWVQERQLRRMVIQISLIAENDLLAFAAGRVRVHGVECATAVCLGDVGESRRSDGVVVKEVNGCDVDGVGDVHAAVAGEVDFPSGEVVGSLMKDVSEV